jgi:hypothetical protein
MNEETVRQWCKMLKNGGHTNIQNEEQSGWASVVSDNLVQTVDKKL